MPELEEIPNLEDYRLPGPSRCYYIPDFISAQEEDYLVRKINESPKPRWKTVPTGRRLQYWGGTLTKANALIPEPLPNMFKEFPNLIERLKNIGAYKDIVPSGEPNLVLVNEYLPGQGIDPHTDGPAYAPSTCTVSLLWPTVVYLHPPPAESYDLASFATVTPPDRPPVAVLLEPRSLFIIQDEVYSTWQHEIKHAEDDDFQIDVINKALLKNERVASLVKGEEGGGRIKRQKRISLTFRAVEKVRHGLSLFK